METVYLSVSLSLCLFLSLCLPLSQSSSQANAAAASGIHKQPRQQAAQTGSKAFAESSTVWLDKAVELFVRMEQQQQRQRRRRRLRRRQRVAVTAPDSDVVVVDPAVCRFTHSFGGTCASYSHSVRNRTDSLARRSPPNEIVFTRSLGLCVMPFAGSFSFLLVLDFTRDKKPAEYPE